jgi:heavy metal sensor kinase
VKPLTLRSALTLIYTGILTLLLAGLGFVYYRVLAFHLDRDATADLRKITSGIRGYIRFDDGVPVLAYDRTDPDEAAFVREATRYYEVYDANSGRVLAQSAALKALGARDTMSDAQTSRGRPQIHDIHTSDGRIRIASSVISPGPGAQYLLRVGVPLDSVDGPLSRFRRLLVWSVVVGLLVAALTGRWMARSALAPFVRLAAATRTISVADLHKRLPIRGAGDEIDEVVEAFNDTLARLEHAVNDMRQFSAALAHELRTPLAALRGEAELALLGPRSPEDYRRTFTSQLEEFDKLARLITQLLTLARAEAGEIALARTPVDLGAIAAAVVEQLEPVAQARDVALACERADGCVVNGDPEWLEQLLINLLDNAIKFTPGHGRVAASASRENGAVRLAVRDTGIGIPADAVPHLFERFYRVDPARTPHADGAGLGLALVKWIADRHGSSIAVASEPGAGTTVTVSFPISGN